ncbi:MAG: (2Fe-2S)-binding protein [Actinomycetota bacterium]|nr:(2Fe-2S)-binding protein [Actinomycetota bacterium]
MMLENGSAWEMMWEKALKGPVAVVDCREEIPCNPCEEVCGRGAIKVGEDICSLPIYNPEACNGCGKCVAVCPGMAVFLIDRSRGNGKARVTVPYEMKGVIEGKRRTWAVDGEGKILGAAKIVKTARMGKEDKTLLVTVEVPENWALKVRGVKDRKNAVGEPEILEEYRGEEDYPFCRCEEVAYSGVRERIGEGFRSFTALRRYSRVGLGVCQGRFCQEMLREEFAARMCIKEGDVGAFKVRPPVRPVKLSRLGGEDD